MQCHSARPAIICLAFLLSLLALPALAGPTSGVAYAIDTSANDATCCGYGVSANYQYQAVAHPSIGGPLAETATTTGGEANTFTTNANTAGLNAASVSAGSTWNLHGTTVSVNATGAVSLAQGALHATIDSDIGSGFFTSANADVHVRLMDNLGFSVAGAGAATATYIGVLFQVHGQYTLADPGNTEVSATLAFSGNHEASMSWDSKQEWCCNGPSPSAPVVTEQSSAPGGGGWSATDFSGTDSQQLAFLGTFAVYGPSDGFDLLADLDLGASGRAIMDYGDTATIRFVLPDNVTLTSESGVFLSQTVPEPGSLALLLVPAALVASLRRRAAGRP